MIIKQTQQPLDKCPTCQATYKSGTSCYRCKSDLTMLLELDKNAHSLITRANNFIRENRYNEALKEVEQSLFVKKTNEAYNLRIWLYLKMNAFDKILANFSKGEE